MKETPHPHRCACGRIWSCRNVHCRANELTWCRLGKESKLGACPNPTAEIKRVAYLEDYADKLLEEGQVLKRDGEDDISRNVLKLEQIVRVRIRKITESVVALRPVGSAASELP